MAITDKDGKFVIENLPVGKHEFRVWHELRGALDGVAIGKDRVDEKGRLGLTIRPGENELPVARVTPQQLEPRQNPN